jgi:hypothetical protein
LSSFGVWLLEADESMPDNNESDASSKEVESECADKEKHDSSFFCWWSIILTDHFVLSSFLTDPRQKMILFVCVQITLVCDHL